MKEKLFLAELRMTVQAVVDELNTIRGMMREGGLDRMGKLCRISDSDKELIRHQFWQYWFTASHPDVIVSWIGRVVEFTDIYLQDSSVSTDAIVRAQAHLFIRFMRGSRGGYNYFGSGVPG
ncbi:hypothetical protein [Austwickia chelonae]|uniref:hypothetical protein n=1 Tax=Austwickia chelonae TaxID=100225 RepID=UPI0013C34DBB|nr:hypothetical protein [Austwickia chelonae]